MNKIDEMLREEDRVTETLKRERDNAEKIRSDVRAGRMSKEEGSKESAQALKNGLMVMFEENPLKAAQIVTETVKGYFRKGLVVGFIVGAALAFLVAVII